MEKNVQEGLRCAGSGKRFPLCSQEVEAGGVLSSHVQKMADLKKCDRCGKIGELGEFKEINPFKCYGFDCDGDLCEKCFKELKKFLKLENEN